MATAIKVENLSKAYQLGQFSTGTLSRDLHRWWALTRGKEDPFLKIGETNDRSKKGESDVVWSLRDLNFEIEQGDTVGIIGRNGAGKSTLLKILSQVTTPTTGTVKVKGRVASLLEVGTGFHPELTGRENIFLNGAILGMRKKEIARKFDEIVDFSGVERYIDTPVKRYSSGMYVRLAFAVAAHLESEILIVDEVLAVGDAEFQKKCLGKMGDISRGDGRTILFVSHNMAAVKSLCENGILLRSGRVLQTGAISDVVGSYLKVISDRKSINLTEIPGTGTKDVEVESIRILNSNRQVAGVFSADEKLYLEFQLKWNNPLLRARKTISGFLDVGFNNESDIRVAWISTSIFKSDLSVDSTVYFEIDSLNLVEGEYNINFLLNIDGKVSDWKQNVQYFKVEELDFYGTGRRVQKDQGYSLIRYKVI